MTEKKNTMKQTNDAPNLNKNQFLSRKASIKGRVISKGHIESNEEIKNDLAGRTNQS